jgi:hypothetical protein
MSVSERSDAYEARLQDDDVICLEVYGTEFVAVVWEDPRHGTVANMRFGSGRHHTGVGIELGEMLARDSIQGVNVVSTERAEVADE